MKKTKISAKQKAAIAQIAVLLAEAIIAAVALTGWDEGESDEPPAESGPRPKGAGNWPQPAG